MKVLLKEILGYRFNSTMQKVFFFIVAVAGIIGLFYIISFFLHYPLGFLLLLSSITIIGFSIYRWLSSFSKKKLLIEVIFKGVDFPPIIIKLKEVGFDLVFALLLLAIGVDPIKDLISLTKTTYSLNYLFLDLALLFSILSFLPMLVFAIYEKSKRI